MVDYSFYGLVEDFDFEVDHLGILWMQLSDNDWLEALCDLEELNASYDTLRINARCRTHLSKHKRILGLEHLIQNN